MPWQKLGRVHVADEHVPRIVRPVAAVDGARVLRILAREDAAAADGLEREAEAADAGEELDEVEAHRAFTMM